MTGNPRRVRVASAMRSALAEMLERDVKDPRVRAAGLVSINQVELNSDMSVARIYVSFSAAESVEDRAVTVAMSGLRAAAGYLRGPVGRRLRLRHSPTLRFVADDSVVFGQKLRDLVRDDEARSQPDDHADSPPRPPAASDESPDES